MDYLLEEPYQPNSKSERRRSHQFDLAMKETFGAALPLVKLSPLFRNYYKTDYGENAEDINGSIKPKNKKHKYQGNLYVLIGAENVSSGTETVDYLKVSKRGVFLGQPTGSTKCECGSALSLKLPNTGLPFWVSSYCSLSNNEEDWKSGIKPDIEIIPTIKELISGKDVTLEKTLEYINNGQ